MNPATEFRLTAKERRQWWTWGTGIVSILPIAFNVLLTNTVDQKLPSLRDICSHGDFLIIAVVLSATSGLELFRLITEKRLANDDHKRAAILCLGSAGLIIGGTGSYPFILLAALQNEITTGLTYYICIFSPLVWLYAIQVGRVATVLVAGSE